MKPFGCAVISALAVSITANPVLRINDRAVVNQAEITTLDFYAQYAAAAYCNDEAAVGSTLTCAEGACPDVMAAGAKVVATFSGLFTDVSGFVSTDDRNQLIVVSVKGSQSLRNWITDLVFLQAPCDLAFGCLVHSGFLTGWTEISQGLLAGVTAAQAANPSYKIVFTGHSLGGAVNTIAAAYARRTGLAVDLYTYGSPRVGNSVFVDFVTNQAGSEYRVTHDDDPVPRLPPITFNYRHTSPEYWITLGNVDPGVYSPTDIQVCAGTANIGCNGGTLGLDVDAHSFYFQDIAGCSPGGFQFRMKLKGKRDVTPDMATTEPTEISDEDLEAKLNEWVAQDREFAEGMKL